MRKILIVLGAILSLSFPVYAQEDAPGQGLVENGAEADDSAAFTEGDEVQLLAGCYTSAANCSGRSYWKNTDGSRYASYRIYYVNGGYSNFVLAPGSDHWVNSRTGDTYASAWGNSGVPNGAPRYSFYVCCN